LRKVCKMKRDVKKTAKGKKIGVSTNETTGWPTALRAPVSFSGRSGEGETE